MMTKREPSPDDRTIDYLEEFYPLNRVSVCESTRGATKRVAERLNGEIHRFPSGTECLSWVIPNNWEVNEAYLKNRETGETIIQYEDHPLTVWSYSESVNRTLSFDELSSHLCYDRERPGAIPYHYRYQMDFSSSGWGFSLPYNKVKNLDEQGTYEVVIDTQFSEQDLVIADKTLPGELDDTILIGAHTCHPGQVNDGLLNVALGMEFFEWLSERDSRRFTYRFVVGPEYFTAAAFLDRVVDVETLRWGLFLDMAANGEDIAFSKSFDGESQIDKAVTSACEEMVDEFESLGYREGIGNDEMFYDGPGFEIPMVGLARDPFTEYHSDQDHLGKVDWEQYQEMLEVLTGIHERLEKNRVPERTVKGPAYLSRYGIDPGADSNKLQKFQLLMDGEKTLLDIAEQVDIRYDELHRYAKQFQNAGLLRFRS